MVKEQVALFAVAAFVLSWAAFGVVATVPIIVGYVIWMFVRGKA